MADNDFDYTMDDSTDEELAKALGLDAGEEESDSEDDKDGENLTLTFKKPFVFEGETYTELNLSGLEELTGADLSKVDRIMRKKTRCLFVSRICLWSSPGAKCHIHGMTESR